MYKNRLTLWEKMKDEHRESILSSKDEYPHMTASVIKSLENNTYVIDLNVGELDSVTMLCNTDDWNKIFELFNY
jgi:hypothetical protein